MQVARAFTAVRPTRPAVSAQRTSVVVQAKPTRVADFSGLQTEELVAKVNSLKRELASTRWLQRTRGVAEMKPGENQPQPDPEKVPKGHVNKHLRRQVAQCLTILRQREIEQGIDGRASRQMAKRAALGAGLLQRVPK